MTSRLPDSQPVPLLIPVTSSADEVPSTLERTEAAKTPRRRRPRPEETVEPMALSAAECSRVAGVSLRTWWSLYAKRRTPDSMKIGRRRAWLRSDVELWLRLGAPSRDRFLAMKQAERRYG